MLFNKIIENLVASYIESGVNVIFEGVQIDTNFILQKPEITGGVILNTDLSIAEDRGDKPKTHFNRKVSNLMEIKYIENQKIKIVDNNKSQEYTFEQILTHLNKLLESQLSNLN